MTTDPPTPRPIQERDRLPLRALLNDVFRRSRGITDQDFLDDFPLPFAAANNQNCRVIVEEGRIVSHAALWERELIAEGSRLKVGVIIGVATEAPFRRRGHAAALMRDLQQTLHEEQYDIGLLWTGVPDFYRKLGWETVLPHGHVIELTPTQNRPQPADACRIVPFTADEHLEGVMALHEREPVCFARTRDDYRKLLALPKVCVWVALRESAVSAYLVHGCALNKRGFVEYGGRLEDLCALTGHVLQAQESPEAIPLLAFHTRPDLVAWAASMNVSTRPMESSKGFGHEMIYVVAPARVPASLCERLFVWGLDHA
jgi:predicted N-acetyltransferase YhbS